MTLARLAVGDGRSRLATVRRVSGNCQINCQEPSAGGAAAWDMTVSDSYTDSLLSVVLTVANGGFLRVLTDMTVLQDIKHAYAHAHAAGFYMEGSVSDG